MNGDRTANDAVIAVESTVEWQVHDILYDGQERYVAPLTFTDHVAKYARKIDWRKLVGAETSADVYNESDEEEDASDKQATSRTQPADSSSIERGNLDLERVKSSPTDEDEAQWKQKGKEETDREAAQAGVGPWDSVAKRLLQSLTEMNVLLDTIQVARNGKYLTLDGVQQDAVEHPKNAVLAAKKKGLTSASAVLLSLADQMRPKPTGGSLVAQQLDPELEELMEMRKHWRLKKVGKAIVGDMSHFSSSGYRPNATFEAKKADMSSARAGSSDIGKGHKGQAWDVALPKDLEETLCLRVTFEAPDGTVSDSASYFGGANVPRIADTMGWQRKLQKAQRTLFCRDLFAQLAREAAHVPELCCAITRRSVIVRLACGHSVRIALEPYSFDDEDLRNTSVPLGEDGAFVLEHNLHQLFDAELGGSREVIIPRPVAAPLTHLSKKARLAGPDALSLNALSSQDASDKFLIQRFLDEACHWLLYKRCKQLVDEFAEECHDPVVSVHWCPETTGAWSVVTIQMMTPFYEFCGKSVVIVEIRVSDVRATMKDGEVVTVTGNLEELARFLKMRARQHVISAVGTLCRPHQWQTLYSNPSHCDRAGDPAPAILVGHPAGTSAIFVKYPLTGEPAVAVQTSSKRDKTLSSDTLRLQANDQRQLWLYLRNELQEYTYRQLPGTNFLHKVELLIATSILGWIQSVRRPRTDFNGINIIHWIVHPNVHIRACIPTDGSMRMIRNEVPYPSNNVCSPYGNSTGSIAVSAYKLAVSLVSQRVLLLCSIRDMHVVEIYP